MYSSGYKPGLQAQKKMQYRSNGKSCGYYMRIVFFFSSLIQSLIIVSLVLFLIYGKKQDSASTSRIQDLEESFSRLSIENVALRQQRKNLTTLLNTTLTEKARNDWDLAQLRYFTNISAVLIQDIDKRLQDCSTELVMCKSQRTSGSCQPTQQSGFCDCGLMFEQLRAKLALVESNFTQTAKKMGIEMDQIAKDRDNLNLEAIRLRRDKSAHEKEIQFFRQKCKDDFVLSLSGVSNVTTAFLRKVDTLFPTHIAFQLTCPKQGEHLEQIRTNCTSLSREVEDKFQRYLNSVGEQVSAIQSESSRLMAENWRLAEDYRWCSQNRTSMTQQHRQNLDKLQQRHDEDKERLLLDKLKLNGQIDVLSNDVKYKTKIAEHLTEQLKQANRTCMFRTVSNGFSGGSPSHAGTRPAGTGWGLPAAGGSSSASSSSSSLGSLGRTGSGSSYSSPYNKPSSTGAGSSSSSYPSAGSSSFSGSFSNKPASTGTGSSSSSFSSAGSSSSSGSFSNKPTSTGTGSSSSSFSSTGSSSSSGSFSNKPTSTGTGSSSSSFPSFGSSSSSESLSNYGSAGSNPSLSSSGTGLNKPVLNGRGSTFGSVASSPSLSSSGTTINKPTSNVRSPSTFGSSSTSTGSTGRTGSTSSGFGSWLGFGNSNSGPNKPGSGTGRGTSTGTGLGGTGSSGRTSGLGGGAVSVSQHLKDLQRLISPAGPEEKQDLSRMLG